MFRYYTFEKFFLQLVFISVYFDLIDSSRRFYKACARSFLNLLKVGGYKELINGTDLFCFKFVIMFCNIR